MPTEVLPDVFDITCLEGDGRRFRALLFTDDRPTLIDAGFAHTADALFEGIAAVGVEPERLIITHDDSDHAGGFDAVVERYDVETWVPETTTLEATHEPDHRYGDGDRIGPYEAIHVPGHTADNSSLVREDRGVLVLGDSLFNADMRGHPPGNVILPPGIYSEDLIEAERNLEKLLDYDYDVALCFHGSTLIEDAKRKITTFVDFPGRQSYIDRIVGPENWGPTT